MGDGGLLVLLQRGQQGELHRRLRLLVAPIARTPLIFRKGRGRLVTLGSPLYGMCTDADSDKNQYEFKSQMGDGSRKQIPIRGQNDFKNFRDAWPAG